MELGGIQTIISKAFEQAKADQIVPLLSWLDGEISKYRISGLCKFRTGGDERKLFESFTEISCRRSKFRNLWRLSLAVATPVQSALTPKINHGQRFVCACGRSFSTEITIRETTNVDTSSPPATPMLLLKSDLKHQQHPHEPSCKRPRALILDPSNSLIPTTTNISIERLNPSAMINHWSTMNLKTYEDSPGLSWLRVRSFAEEMFVSLQNY